MTFKIKNRRIEIREIGTRIFLDINGSIYGSEILRFQREFNCKFLGVTTHDRTGWVSLEFGQ